MAGESDADLADDTGDSTPTAANIRQRFAALTDKSRSGGLARPEWCR